MSSCPSTATKLARIPRFAILGVLKARTADKAGRFALREATNAGSLELGQAGNTPVAARVAIAEAMADNFSDADSETEACNCAISEADAPAARLAAATTDNKPSGSESEKSGRSKSAANDNALCLQKQLII
jgi:hypothetical protein